MTATESICQHQTGTSNSAISDTILLNLSSPDDSHSTTGTRLVTDARAMTDDSSTAADVSPTVGALQPTILGETLLELNEARAERHIYRQRLEQLEADRETEHQRRQQLEARLQHLITEEKHLTKELRVYNDK